LNRITEPFASLWAGYCKQLLNGIVAVQVSDTTIDDSSNAADYINLIIHLLLLREEAALRCKAMLNIFHFTSIAIPN